MHSAKIHDISESDHFVDYAELPNMEDWDDKMTRLIRREEEAEVMLGAVVTLVAVVFLVWAVPLLLRWLR